MRLCISRNVLVRLTMLACSLATIPPVAFAQEFLSSREVATKLADGKPWNGQVGSKTMKITFNANGSGQLDEPMNKSMSWAVLNDQLCIEFGFPIGTKCLRFRQAAKGYDSFEGNAPSISFSR